MSSRAREGQEPDHQEGRDSKSRHHIETSFPRHAAGDYYSRSEAVPAPIFGRESVLPICCNETFSFDHSGASNCSDGSRSRLKVVGCQL